MTNIRVAKVVQSGKVSDSARIRSTGIGSYVVESAELSVPSRSNSLTMAETNLVLSGGTRSICTVYRYLDAS